MDSRLKDIVSPDQFDLNFLIHNARDTNIIRELLLTREGKDLLTHVLPGYMIGEFFWQESSRTYHSFAAAGEHLGARVKDERGVKRTKVKNGARTVKWELIFSSEMKDAHLEDEVRAWASFYDALILRTPEEGMVARIINILREFGYDAPVISAGDGKGHHPTQSLLDAYVLPGSLGLDIEKDWKLLSSHRVAFVGDGGSRVVHSLAPIFGKIFKMPISFITPKGLGAPAWLLKDLKSANVDYEERDTLRDASVYYVIRLQDEYLKKAKNASVLQNYYSITKKVADQYNVRIVMHPFPRSKTGNELPIWLPSDPKTHEVSLDKDPRAFYFYQMFVGMPVRMALLKYLLNPYLDLKKLKEERLIRQIRSQCVSCNRIEYHELGWAEYPPACGYIQTLPHIFCPKCQPPSGFHL